MGRKRPIIVEGEEVGYIGPLERCLGRGELPWNRDTLGWQVLLLLVGI